MKEFCKWNVIFVIYNICQYMIRSRTMKYLSPVQRLEALGIRDAAMLNHASEAPLS